MVVPVDGDELPTRFLRRPDEEARLAELGTTAVFDGVGGDLKATLEGGTFSEVSGKDI